MLYKLNLYVIFLSLKECFVFMVELKWGFLCKGGGGGILLIFIFNFFWVFLIWFKYFFFL